MSFTEIKGDLFSDEVNSLAHCVSADFAMGAGIAKIFRKKFGQVNKLLEQKKGVGEVAYLEEETEDGKRYIFYLVTKEEYWHKPSYETLEASLKEMLKLCKKLGVKSVSMPRIGCGLDLLDWSKVKDMIKEVFKDLDVSIYTI